MRRAFTLIELLVVVAIACRHALPRAAQRGMNVLFYDGHVKFRKPSTLRDSDFRVPGSPPPTAIPLPP